MTRLSKENWEALRPLLDEALELESQARPAWLAEQRKSNPTLVAELEALLNSEPEADREGFLKSEHKPAMPSAGSSLAGQMLGAYRLERTLGQGGMGTVWLARRADGRFEGVVAIKFLSLAVAGPVGEARFRREGSLLARLAHPNIARLLDAGVTPAGQPYLVLEHVEGRPLDGWCDERKLSAEARIRLFLQVLAAVAHAHGNLIVHRDLKPSNILVTPDGMVKLLDFGIAKLLDPEGLDPGIMTRSHERILTFAYAAPEQIRGEPISTATDVYSLGVLLYEVLAGRHPTGGNSRTPGDQVRAVLDEEPTQLPQAVTPSGALSREEALRLAASRDTSPEKLKREYRGDLQNILAKALRKAPAERYPTVSALADDLERYLRHEPVSARPDAWSYRAGKFLQRNRGAVAGAVLVTLTLIGAAVVTGLQAREARRQRDAALFQTKRADAQIEFQSLLLSEVGDKPITMREILDKGRDVLERQYSGDPQFLTTLLLQLSARYGELGERRTRGELLARAESLAVAGQGAEYLAEIRCHAVDHLRSQGSYPEAWSMMARAESTLQATPDPETEVACLQIRSGLATETGRTEESLNAIRRAIAIEDSLGGPKDMSYVDLLGTLALGLHGQGQFREALGVYQRAIAAMDSSGRGGQLGRTILRHNLAGALGDMGELVAAESVFHETLEQVARSDHTGRIEWQPMVHYAEVALYQNRPDSAFKYFAKIVAQAVQDTNLYWEGRGLFGLGRTQVQLGKPAEARRSMTRLQEIVSIYPHVQDTDDVFPDPLMLQGLLARAGGDTVTAHDRFREALTSNGYFEGKMKRRLRPAAVLAAETALALGRVDDALDLARKVRERATVDSLADTRSAYVGEARVIEGRALLAKGDSAGAREALERGLSGLKIGAGPDHPRTIEATRLLAALRP